MSSAADSVIVTCQCVGSTRAGGENDTESPAGGDAANDGTCWVKMSMKVWLDWPAPTGLAAISASAGVLPATNTPTAMSRSSCRRRVFIRP
jgi:hypothetical protein